MNRKLSIAMALTVVALVVAAPASATTASANCGGGLTGKNITLLKSTLTGKLQTGRNGVCWVATWVGDDGLAKANGGPPIGGSSNVLHFTEKVAVHDADAAPETWKYTISYPAANATGRAAHLAHAVARRGTQLVTFTLNV